MYNKLRITLTSLMIVLITIGVFGFITYIYYWLIFN